MDINQSEKKYSSKTHRFFDLLYKMLVMNLCTIIIGLPIVTLFPAIVATVATMKNSINENGIFKIYFKNFGKYFWSSFKMGLAMIIVIVVMGYSFLFWIFQDFENDKMEWVSQAGIIVMIICILVFILSTVHLPFLMIIIPQVNNFQKFKLSIYISIRYILTTFIMLLATLFIILPVFLTFFQFIRYGFIGVWMLIGISLPLFLEIKVTGPIYYKIEKIDFKKINEQIEEDLKNE